MNIDKLLTVISLLLITAALIVIAATPLAAGYELSIYNAYPGIFWFFIICSITCGISILVHQAFSERKSSWWLAGFIIIILCNMIITSLPYFHGYFLYGRGDSITHLGYAKDILITGRVPQSLIYPLLHILLVQMNYITGLSLGITQYLLVPFFNMLFIVNVYLLATSIAKYRGQALLITAFASPLILSFYHGFIYPIFVTLFMIPLLLYFFHKIAINRISNTIGLLLLALFMTYAHPYSTLLCILMMIVFGVSKWLLFILAKHSKSVSLEPMAIRGHFIVAALMFIFCFVWYINFPGLVTPLKKVIIELIIGIASPSSQDFTSWMSGRNLPFYETAKMFFFNYGAIFIYFSLAALSMLLVLVKYIFKKELSEIITVYFFQLLFAVSIALLNLFGANFLGSLPIRIVSFSLVMTIPLNGLVIYKYFIEKIGIRGKGRALPVNKIASASIMLVILCATTISIFNVFKSPLTWGDNNQITKMQMAGCEWWSQNTPMKAEIPTVTSVHYYLRMDLSILYGVQESFYYKAWEAPEPTPDHFGYDKAKTLAEYWSYLGRFMVTFIYQKEAPMIYPEELRPQIKGQFNEQDFIRLNSDPTVIKVYNNPEYDVWRIYGTGKYY